MAKEDAIAPARPPVKRRALERAPDHWIAIWASSESLPEADKERVRDERERRRIERKTKHLVLGILPDPQGLTPQQLDGLKEQLQTLKPTAIHHPWVARPVAGACRALGVPVQVLKDVRDERAPLRSIVLASDVVIGFPRGFEQTSNRSPAWEALSYARHRKLRVRVVLPDGTMKGEEG